MPYRCITFFFHVHHHTQQCVRVTIEDGCDFETLTLLPVPTILHPPSASICHSSSITHHPLPTTHHPLIHHSSSSIIHHQPHVINRSSSITQCVIHHPSSIIHHPLIHHSSSLSHHPSLVTNQSSSITQYIIHLACRIVTVSVSLQRHGGGAGGQHRYRSIRHRGDQRRQRRGRQKSTNRCALENRLIGQSLAALGINGTLAHGEASCSRVSFGWGVASLFCPDVKV